MSRWPVAAAIIAVIGIICTGGGCGPKRDAAAPPSRSDREGYVYIALLVPEHPLYQQLRRLDEEIRSLRTPITDQPTAVASPGKMAQLVLSAPAPPEFPLERFASRRADWAQSPSLLGPPTNSPLAPDLHAELTWRRQQIEEEGLREAAQTRATIEERVVAERRAAIQSRQEQLNNLALDVRDDDPAAVAAAEAERQGIWQDIEAQHAANRAEAEHEISQLQAQVQQRAAARIQALQADIWQRQGERSQIASNSGGNIRSGMSNMLSAPGLLSFDDPATWSAAALSPESGAERASGRVVAQGNRRRAQQAQVLTQRRMALARRLYETTVTVVQGLAGERGLAIAVPPLEEPRGEDLTEVIRPMLRELYATSETGAR